MAKRLTIAQQAEVEKARQRAVAAARLKRQSLLVAPIRTDGFDSEAIGVEVIKVTKKLFKAKTAGVYKLLSTERGTLESIRSAVQDLVGSGEGEAATLVDTGLSILGRARLGAVAEGLGLTNYLYSGGEIATTREFCTERDGQYFTEDEIKGWADEEWDGKIDGTTEETIFDYCGGWNCRHELIPVSEAALPDDVRSYNEEAAKNSAANQVRLRESQNN